MDETHGIGHQDRLSTRQLDAAGCGIEGGKELVRHEYPFVGQLIEQGGFSGVRISDKGHRGDLGTPSPGSVSPAVGSQLLSLALQMGNTPTDLSFIHFQLRLARSTQADPTLRACAPRPTSGLSGQMCPSSRQPRESIFILG